MDKTNPKYNLEERTAVFGEDVILFLKLLPDNHIVRPLVNQIIRSATSIGANYMEANGASSRKDFRNKICICKKESNETKHWLRMISMAVPDKSEDCRKLWQEAQELTMIFAKIIVSSSQF